MKIIFNLFDTGLGNNGGSHTLVKSANTLVDLGHEVIITDSIPNCYTWTPFKFKHLLIKNSNEFPNADVIISTGMGSLKTTNESKIDKKFIWIRGWETWKYPEDKLVKMLKQSSCVKLVNGICLQQKLKQYGIDSIIARPGYDFEEFEPLNCRQNNEPIVLGGLYNQGKKRSTKRTEWIINTCKKLQQVYRNQKVELWMMSAEGHSQDATFLMHNPNKKDKNFLYNKVDIWLCPSELEGLHLAPAEAMLTECCVVGTNAEMSGTQDYLIHGETGFVSNNNFIDFFGCVLDAVLHKEERLAYGKNGRQKILSIGNRKYNMSNFIELLK